MADDAPAPPGRTFPRVPGYAWTWFQRSRPVVAEAAERLTGSPPGPGFVDDLRAAFDRDPFTRDVVIGVVADVAFGGRAPVQRPPGASWDRGLTWWAAALAGMSPADFEARVAAPSADQHRLFDAGGPERGAGGRPPDPGGLEEAARRHVAPRVARSPERAALAAALRELLATAASDQIAASAVRQLLAQLEDGELR
jgi:hypothetical protein